MRRGISPEEGYARYAGEYDEKTKFWDSFEKDAIKPYVASSSGMKVLDAGAGTGRISLRLQDAGAEVTALDISDKMLKMLTAKNPKIETVTGDMENMPFEDDTFDRVFSSLALIHLKKITPFLDECYRVMKDGGILILVNIHYRKAEVLHDGQGRYTIKGYNHFPRHVVKAAEELAFGIEHEEIITEGDDVWVSQVLILKK